MFQRYQLHRPTGLSLPYPYLYHCTQLAIALVSSCVVALAMKQPSLAAFISPQRSQQGMVVSAHPQASDAGLTMLRQGGNAVDAAVATAFVISVVEPFSAGIGGGGFLLFHAGKTGETTALDFREQAPQLATRNMFLDTQGRVRPQASVDGHLAVAVPGTVAGLYEVHRRYGQLPWSKVVNPAIQLAQGGFEITPRFVESAAARKAVILRNSAARQVFTRDGVFYKVGDRLVQRDLAKTLQAIAQDPQAFYRGWIAAAIARDMAKNGGLITAKDLQLYHPTWRTPICGPFRQYQVCSMPPPSSGGVHLLEILNIVGDADLKSWGWHSPDALHLLASAMQIAYADRAVFLGDPKFVQVPVNALTSRAYAATRRQEIPPRQARSSKVVKAVDPAVLKRFMTTAESDDTTHLTVVDPARNAVSLTFTVNGPFGAGVVAPGTGILLNNEMDDFAIAPGIPNLYGLVGNDANAVAPGKIPLSSMTPTIVTERGKLRLAVGSPGGSTIITTVLQIILNVLVYDMDAGAAVSASRIHHQWLPDELRVEPWGLDAATLRDLRQRGYQVQERSPWGNANLIVVAPNGELQGAADPRGEGAARGL
ncbi:gamma-glutamyltransferase [Trichocoleus sp. FACHB-262]|uniref:gamma-glutamyltransferase n=1 Tax=Trichocoleus sp. FACHB-262 TaxID=2692869 RepID=UPI001F54C460|nr:gamma-glutamyltransferase [Trichocoleus sp. FACHB-262]